MGPISSQLDVWEMFGDFYGVCYFLIKRTDVGQEEGDA